MVVFVFASSGNSIRAQGFLKTDGKKIVNEKGENVLLRGMGLGGWMVQEGYMLRIHNQAQQHRIRKRLEELTSPEQTKEFYETWLANNIRKIDIDSMKSWGFNSVRLPMHYNLYTLPIEKEPVKGGNTWLDKGFQMTDSLLSWCRQNGMYLILDLHAAPGGQGNDLNISDRDTTYPSLWASEENKRKTIALWKKLAGRYANEPNIAAYDLINEPNFGFEDPVNDKNGINEKKNEPLTSLLKDITAAIREVDKKHIIIIEGNGWGNNYNGMLPPWDDNMVLSFHKYWSFNTDKEIRRMLDAREKYNIPVWLGETGENSNVWFTEAIRLLEKHNIGWAWWPAKKMGPGNPLEIPANHNFMQVVDFFNGTGEQPKESDVYSGMIEAAVYAKLENCIFHPDVIDAMFRQVYSDEAIPFRENKIDKQAIIQAVDYDLGRQGSAYYDRDTANYHVSGQPGRGNRGNTYRNDGVDIRKDSSHYEQYFVSDIEDGEWLQYTVHARPLKKYKLRIYYSAQDKRASIDVKVNNKIVAENIYLPATGGMKSWKSIYLNNLIIGNNARIRIQAKTGGFNLKQLEFIEQN
ncbi:MAG: cellulase family glycosylhydrolase [Chitinophagaceae bacterium]|nr:cellulase family glycosylhydrolase [Chitinophagaceae bacterium]